LSARRAIIAEPETTCHSPQLNPARLRQCRNDALLLSANLRDFNQIPDLRVENWLA
jgi:hypothetical protein